MARITDDLLSQLEISLGRFREEQTRGIEYILVANRFTHGTSEEDWIRFGKRSRYQGYPTHYTETWITLPDTDMSVQEYLLRERAMSMLGAAAKRVVPTERNDVKDYVGYVSPVMTMPLTFRAEHQPDIPSRLVGYRTKAVVDTDEGALILEVATATNNSYDGAAILRLMNRYLGEALRDERDFSARHIVDVLKGYGLSIDAISVSKLRHEQGDSPVKVNGLSKLGMYADLRELTQKDELNVCFDTDVAKVGADFIENFDRATRQLIGNPTVIRVTTDNLILGSRGYTLDGSGRAPLEKSGTLYCKMVE